MPVHLYICRSSRDSDRLLFVFKFIACIHVRICLCAVTFLLSDFGD